MSRYAVVIMKVSSQVTVGRMDRAIDDTFEEGWDALEEVAAPLAPGEHHSDHMLCVAVVEADSASDVGWRIGADHH